MDHLIHEVKMLENNTEPPSSGDDGKGEIIKDTRR